MKSEKGRAMVNLGPDVPWEMMEFPVPAPEPDAIVTRITMSSVCGSDVHIYKGELGPVRPGEKPKPQIPGHEFVGRIHKLGSNVKTDTAGQPLKEGDRVTWTVLRLCGKCYSCVNEIGRCSDRSAATFTFGEFPYFKGAFCDYYYISPGQWIYKVPDEVPDEAAVYVSCAAGTVSFGLGKVKFPLGATVVIQGAGGLGINATPLAKDMGAARVIVIDKNPERLKFVKSFGADYTIDANEYPAPQDRIERVKQLAGGNGANVVVEVVGSAPEVVPEGLQM
ncbi:alcohol dehydrogenase catalytic domain-containing protein, partial [Chloroflexota bacterium]